MQNPLSYHINNKPQIQLIDRCNAKGEGHLLLMWFIAMLKPIFGENLVHAELSR